jgi:hypothetical protein
MVIGLLMGRKGSEGFPGKNLFSVLGKPLAQYPMEAAIKCDRIDATYLSTDDEKLMALARRLDIGVIERPAELCTSKALGEHVYRHGCEVARQRNAGREIEIVVLLMCNAATVTAGMIAEGIDVLEKNPDYDSAVSVSCYNMWSPLRARRIDADGLLKPFVPFESFGDPATLNCDRDSQGDVWFADMGVSVVRRQCLENLDFGLLPQKWMGRSIYPLKQWGGLDVDFEWQVPLVEYWLKEHQDQL